ncbi:MAG TPA: hypothetical protein VMM92_07790 [Thermoanaerobaculia bacterium]|nr:hypothetical protein [Thermoanaerobaculia bacterium]
MEALAESQVEKIAKRQALAAPFLAERTAALPWYLQAALLGSTSIAIGLLWDISWHATIGRDTFWTPAHMAIYLGGLLAGLSSGLLALKTTFSGTDGERAASVRFWGFRAPLGAWVVIWGAFAMLTSAPFDDWWHNAYGLDVKIISPPHMVLAAGMIAIQLGTQLLAVAWANRGAAAAKPRLTLAFTYASGILLVFLVTMLIEYSTPGRQHTAFFYKISLGVYPLALLAVARGARLRWGATWAALSYTAFSLAATWILPLFPARPLLAPIYNPVTHMWPIPFPLLLILPAVGIDLLVRRLGTEREWRLAWAAAAMFLAVFFLAQWFFAEFMLSPHSRNWFFASDQWPYYSHLGSWRYEFRDVDVSPVTPLALGIALLLGAGSARLGLLWGRFLGRVQR